MSARFAAGRGPCLWLLVAAASAQEAPTIEGIVQGLADRSPGRVAWAAHAARLADARKLIAPLQQALRTWAKEAGDEASAAQLFVLDALLALGAKLPAAELMAFVDDPRAGVPAFVLLCRESQQNEAELFELFQRPLPSRRPDFVHAQQPHLRRTAIGDLLAAQKTPGLAAFLWQRLDFALRVEVRTDRSVSSASTSFSIVRQNKAQPLAGFPPVPSYQLIAVSAEDGPLPVPFARIVDGLRVGYERTLPDMPSRGTAMRWLAAAEQANDLAWLEQLAGLDLPVGARTLDLVYTTPEAYRDRVGKAQQALRTELGKLRDGLLAQKALLAHELANCPTTVEVVVDDQRNDQKQALPEIAPLK